MQARWTVIRGPEFAASTKACAMSPKRLSMHLTAIELNLERDPFSYSEAYSDESHRVLDTHDYFVHDGGACLTAFIVVHTKRLEVEISWIEAGSLPTSNDDFDDDEV